MEKMKLQFQGQLYRCRADMLRDIAREWVSGGGVNSAADIATLHPDFESIDACREWELDLCSVTVEELTPYMRDAINAAACE